MAKTFDRTYRFSFKTAAWVPPGKGPSYIPAGVKTRAEAVAYLRSDRVGLPEMIVVSEWGGDETANVWGVPDLVRRLDGEAFLAKRR